MPAHYPMIANAISQYENEVSASELWNLIKDKYLQTNRRQMVYATKYMQRSKVIAFDIYTDYEASY